MKNRIFSMFFVVVMILGNINMVFAETEDSSKIVEAKEESIEPQLIWSDEFDGTELDATKWIVYKGLGGYASSEVPNYDIGCYEVKNGNLVIKPQFEWNKSTQKVVRNSHKPAKIWTKDICSFKYGKIEVRAKLSKGQGTAPMVWMLGNDNTWPLSGEIDILETRKGPKSQIIQSIQCNKYNEMPMSEGEKSKISAISNTTSEYHTYGIIWDKYKITFTIDGKETWTYNPDEFSGSEDGHKNSELWPFNQPFYFILNCDIGQSYCEMLSLDNWTKIASNGDIETYEDYFYIDYVRVYDLEYIPYAKPTYPLSKVKGLTAKNKKGKKVKLSWKKVTNAKGYQITYARNKKFTKGKKSIFTNKRKYTVKKLKKKKTYYFKVRAYKVVNGRKVYGLYNKVKKSKDKKII